MRGLKGVAPAFVRKIHIALCFAAVYVFRNGHAGAVVPARVQVYRAFRAVYPGFHGRMGRHGGVAQGYAFAGILKREHTGFVHAGFGKGGRHLHVRFQGFAEHRKRQQGRVNPDVKQGTAAKGFIFWPSASNER